MLVACGAEQNTQVSVWDNYHSLAVKIDDQGGSESLEQLANDATKLTKLSP
jgi:hypothetical protein|tara:strand:+ start:669 stop:821 length:153 start_codon:yes stop_codon:yes gene_type:complete